MNQLAEQTIPIIDETGVFSSVSHICSHGDPEEATQAFSDVSNHCYWKRKNLAEVIAVACAGAAYGLAAAAGLPYDQDRAYRIRSSVKGIYYNLASFTWNGWDEPGISPGPAELSLGLEAARMNLQLAQDLNKGDIPMSRAWWMLGGQQISAGRAADAAESFLAAARHAEAASAAGEVLMALAFVGIARASASPDDAEARAETRKRREELRPEKEGEFFISQVDAAWKVFKCGPPLTAA